MCESVRGAAVAEVGQVPSGTGRLSGCIAAAARERQVARQGARVRDFFGDLPWVVQGLASAFPTPILTQIRGLLWTHRSRFSVHLRIQIPEFPNQDEQFDEAQKPKSTSIMFLFFGRFRNVNWNNENLDTDMDTPD